MVPIQRKPGTVPFLSFLRQSIHKSKTAPLPALPHKTQTMVSKCLIYQKKKNQRPKQFQQSRKFYKKLFLAPFSYHVMLLPQSVFQNRFFKIPSKITSETTPASLLPDQVTTSPRHKPTSTPLTNKTVQKFPQSSLNLRYLPNH